MKSILNAALMFSVYSLGTHGLANEFFTGPSDIEREGTCTEITTSLGSDGGLVTHIQGLEAEQLYWKIAKEQGIEEVTSRQIVSNGKVDCIQAGPTYTYGTLLNIPYLCTNGDLPEQIGGPVGSSRVGPGAVIGAQCRVFQRPIPNNG